MLGLRAKALLKTCRPHLHEVRSASGARRPRSPPKHPQKTQRRRSVRARDPSSKELFPLGLGGAKGILAERL